MGVAWEHAGPLDSLVSTVTCWWGFPETLWELS